MLSQEVSLTFIFGTIAVILCLTAVGVYLVNKKAKELKKEEK